MLALNSSDFDREAMIEEIGACGVRDSWIREQRSFAKAHGVARELTR